MDGALRIHNMGTKRDTRFLGERHYEDAHAENALPPVRARLGLHVTALAFSAFGIPRTSFGRRDMPLSSSQHGFQLLVPVLTIAQMLLADMFPWHDRPWTLGAEPLLLVTQLIGPRCRGMQLSVMRALLALDPQGAQTMAMVAPPTELSNPCQGLPAFPAENRSAQATLSQPVFLPVPFAKDDGPFGKGARADSAQPHSSVPGLIFSSWVARQAPRVPTIRVLPHCFSQPPRTRI